MTVQLKGRVACEMGSHELMITEIVLRCNLAKKKPAEIAALLSCLVFKQRTRNEPVVPTDTLKEVIHYREWCLLGCYAVWLL
jgi:antiviral helicase SKI2